MHRSTHTWRLAALFILLLAATVSSAQAQTSPAADNYSDSIDSTRSRSATRPAPETNPASLLRAARTIHVRPNKDVDAEYLEYKLDKLSEFGRWHLVFVRESARADLTIEIHRTALNYIFSIIEPESGVVLTKGKVVAINGLVAAEDISKEIIKKMRSTRALPAGESE